MVAVTQLVAPIPGLDGLRSRRRSRFFAFGGCLFWLIFIYFVVLAWVLILSVLALYVGVVVMSRLLALAFLAFWWGCESGAGVIQRARQ
jgi:hypothetical protein